MVRLTIGIDKRDENNTIKYIHQNIDLTLCEIVNTPNSHINGNVGYITLEILQNSGGILLDGYITEICITSKTRKHYEISKGNE